MLLRLLQIEWIKLFHSRTFLVLLGLYSAICMLSVYVLNTAYQESIKLAGDGQAAMVMGVASTLFFSPEVWKLMIYISSFLNFLLILVFILMLSNEYKYNALRQHVIDGLDYKDLIIGKQLFIGFLVFFAIINIIVLTTLIAKNSIFISFNQSAYVLFHYMLSLFFLLNFSYLIMTLTKRTIPTIMVILFYRLLEFYLSYELPESIAHWLPFNVMNRLVPIPAEDMVRAMNVPISSAVTTIDILVCFVWSLICIGLVYLKLSKSTLTR